MTMNSINVKKIAVCALLILTSCGGAWRTPREVATQQTNSLLVVQAEAMIDDKRFAPVWSITVLHSGEAEYRDLRGDNSIPEVRRIQLPDFIMHVLRRDIERLVLPTTRPIFTVASESPRPSYPFAIELIREFVLYQLYEERDRWPGGGRTSRVTRTTGFDIDANGRGSNDPACDAAGNLTFDGTQKLTFEGWNRLVSVAHAYRDGSNDVQAGQKSVTMSYDGRGSRTGMRVDQGGRMTQWNAIVFAVLFVLVSFASSASAHLHPGLGRFMWHPVLAAG